MEDISMNYGMIPRTGARQTTQEAESSGQAEMCGNIHGWEHVIEKLDAILTSLIYVLTPQNINPSYLDKVRHYTRTE